MVLPEPAL
jgi:hypothetical protein